MCGGGGSAARLFPPWRPSWDYAIIPGNPRLGRWLPFYVYAASSLRAGCFRIGVPTPVAISARRADSISDIIKARAASHRQAGKLIGKPPYAITRLFAKFARTQLRPIYQKLYRKAYCARLSDVEHRTVGWRKVSIRPLTSRRAISRGKSTRWILYADAATDPPKIGALLSADTTPDAQIRGGGVALLAHPRRGLFRRSDAVLCLELLAVVGALV